MEVELTELYDLEVERHDGVANPASGFSFLVTKSAAPAAKPEGESMPAEPAEKAEEIETPETSEAAEKSEAPAAPEMTVESVQELIKAALAERESAAEERVAKAEAEVAALKTELDVLKAKPLPGGPVISATADQRATKAKNEALVKAAHWRHLANSVTDRELIAEYTRRAKAAEAEAN